MPKLGPVEIGYKSANLVSVFATGPRAVGFYNRLGRAGRHHADDHLVESEYRNVFLKLFPRYAGRAHRGATVASKPSTRHGSSSLNSRRLCPPSGQSLVINESCVGIFHGAKCSVDLLAVAESLKC